MSERLSNEQGHNTAEKTDVDAKHADPHHQAGAAEVPQPAAVPANEGGEDPP